MFLYPNRGTTGRKVEEKVKAVPWSERGNFWLPNFSTLTWAKTDSCHIKGCLLNCLLRKTGVLSLCLLSVKTLQVPFIHIPSYREQDKLLCCGPSRQCHLGKCSDPVSRILLRLKNEEVNQVRHLTHYGEEFFTSSRLHYLFHVQRCSLFN